MADKVTDDVFEQYFESNRQLTNLLMKEVHECLNSYGDLQHTAFAILKVLKADGPLSQHEIALQMCHTDASVSKLVTALVEKKYVSVQEDPENRRRVLVDITPQGIKALAKVKEHLLNELRVYFDASTKKKLIELTKFNKELQQNILEKQKEN